MFLDFFFVTFFVSFSRYPGYAKYRDIFSFRQARFLWFAESGTDICYPAPRQAVLYPELLALQTENRLLIRCVRWELEESARIKKFMLAYEGQHLLRTQMIRSYLNMSESYKRNCRERMYYSIQEETVYQDLLSARGKRRPRPY